MEQGDWAGQNDEIRHVSMRYLQGRRFLLSCKRGLSAVSAVRSELSKIYTAQLKQQLHHEQVICSVNYHAS